MAVFPEIMTPELSWLMKCSIEFNFVQEANALNMNKYRLANWCQSSINQGLKLKEKAMKILGEEF